MKSCLKGHTVGQESPKTLTTPDGKRGSNDRKLDTESKCAILLFLVEILFSKMLQKAHSIFSSSKLKIRNQSFDGVVSQEK